MGLDMFLNGEKHICSDDEVEIIVKPDILNGYRIKRIVIELLYWRKSNQVHMWFVKNIQKGKDDCKRYYVKEKQLKELYDTVCAVLLDRTKAKTLLPTQGGFFFGGTDYNEYYFQDLEETKTGLEKIFNSGILKDFLMYYWSSW